MATKRALIIGINRYPHLSEKYQLKGCINDAVLIKSLLVSRFQFDPANIEGIANSGATQAGIRAALQRLEDATQENDIVVFHYSGHGHQCKIKTSHADEGSGKDSCLLPYDDSEILADGTKAFREIRDNEIAQWLERMTSKTPYVTMIVDACHSGTINRGGHAGSQARGVPEYDRETPAEQQRIGKPVRKSAGGWFPKNSDYVVMSGCRDTQTSKERYFQEGKNKYRHGVLTYSLAQALQRAEQGTTYRDVFDIVSAKAQGYAKAQNPQIAGQLDRELFGIKDFKPEPFLRVTAVENGVLTLAGGAAHGVTVGSTWSLYAPGTKQFSADKQLATATITHCRASQSSAKVDCSNTAIAVGARCQQIGNAPSETTLSISTSSIGAARRAQLEKCIKQSRLLSIADSADINAQILPAGTVLKASTEGGRSHTLSEDSWVFFEDDQLAFPIHPVSEAGIEKRLTDNLEKTARFRNAVLLDNNLSALKVEFNVYRRLAKANAPDEPELQLANGGATEFVEGERIAWELKNTGTHSVFVSVLCLTSSKAIVPVFPPRRASVELRAGTTIWLGVKDKQKIRGRLAANFVDDLGVDTFKAFFSTEQCDFSWLQQSATRSDKQRLPALETAINGQSTRAGLNPEPEAENKQGDWQAINRAIVLRRKLAGCS